MDFYLKEESEIGQAPYGSSAKCVVLQACAGSPFPPSTLRPFDRLMVVSKDEPQREPMDHIILDFGLTILD